MKIMKKRANGKGTIAHLNGTRNKPYAARLLIGKDIEGKPIYYDIDTFETELDTLVCLENYCKNPTPLSIKIEKYNRIVFWPKNPYPLVPVQNVQSTTYKKSKKHYTFKQVFEEMKEVQFPTKEEIQLEKEKHIKPERKICLS